MAPARGGATRVLAIGFGVFAGLLGLEHGCFETLQGHAGPSGLAINAIGPPCVPAAAWHGCEPAITLVYDFLITGFSMAVALVLVGWTAAFVTRAHGGLVGHPCSLLPICRATNVDYRMDTPSVREFLGPYVTLP